MLGNYISDDNYAFIISHFVKCVWMYALYGILHVFQWTAIYAGEAIS